MMGRCDMRSAEPLGCTEKKRIAGFARPLLEIGRGGIERRINIVGLLDEQLDAEGRTKLAHKGLVAIGLRPAQAMVQMSGREPISEARRKVIQGMEQRDRVGGAREG